ncbi:NIPSNAP family protein [Streptosporangium sp. NPDC051022]|uniref:NIPSNAP family protein n=1 Tax=Streptosporangium sp. NPDC051022 TaxID=3155752 RepID=UPI003427D734
MIYEEQTYTMGVAKAAALVDAYERRGLAVLGRHFGDLVAFWTVDVGGDIDQVIQVWGFQDHNDRARRRAALLADPDWQEFAAEFGGLITRREMRILTAAPFSPHPS